MNLNITQKSLCCEFTVLCKSLEPPLISLYFASKEPDNRSPGFSDALSKFRALVAFSLIFGPGLVPDHFQMNGSFCLFVNVKIHHLTHVMNQCCICV